MSHHTFIKLPAGRWISVDVPTHDRFQRIDDQLYGSINGDTGGIWNPTSPITLGNLKLAAPISLATPASYSRLIELTDARCQYTFVGSQAPRAPTPTINPAFFGFQTGVNGCQPAIDISNYLHDGATLANVRLTFAVGEAHVAVPASLPLMEVVRFAPDFSSGGVLGGGSLSSALAVALAAPGTGTDWYAGGADQILDFVCDQNNVIDRSQYVYFVIFIEESGAGAFSSVSNAYKSLRLDFEAIAGMGPV